jgi:DoxX-like family
MQVLDVGAVSRPGSNRWTGRRSPDPEIEQEGNETVFVAYVIVTIITIVANVGAAAADLGRAKFVLANMKEIGVRGSWLTPLGLLKGAGAAGLLIGLLGPRTLGIAAAIGLVLFFAGALAYHLRARVFHNIATPGAYLALAIASAAFAAVVY